MQKDPCSASSADGLAPAVFSAAEGSQQHQHQHLYFWSVGFHIGTVNLGTVALKFLVMFVS